LSLQSNHQTATIDILSTLPYSLRNSKHHLFPIGSGHMINCLPPIRNHLDLLLRLFLSSFL